jgi:hypothetical protein
VRCRPTFPFIALSSAAEPPHERHASTLPIYPVPSRDVAPAATRAPLGAISSAIQKIGNPTGVDTEVVSGIGKISFGYLDEILLGAQPTSLGTSVAITSRQPYDGMPNILGEYWKPSLQEAAVTRLSEMISTPDPSRITDEATHLTLQVHCPPAMPVRFLRSSLC